MGQGHPMYDVTWQGQGVGFPCLMSGGGGGGEGNNEKVELHCLTRLLTSNEHFSYFIFCISRSVVSPQIFISFSLN